MKNIIYIIFLIGTIATAISCTDNWTDVEAKEFNPSRPNEYYENLRAYKKSDHAIVYGWFGGWTGKGPSLISSLAGLPDSMDIVSIWGNWSNLTKDQQEDMKFVQTKKGTRVVFSFIIQNIGDQLTPEGEDVYKFWGIDKNMEEAIKKYAQAIADTVTKYNYDGFDMDYEPNAGHSGNLGGNEPNVSIFIKELAKTIGPKSGSGRLFLIDSQGEFGPTALGDHFDYFVRQAYYSGSDIALQGWFSGPYETYKGYSSDFFSSKKFILTENFEANPDGGVKFKDANGVIMTSFEGMARWNPQVGRKGGAGVYHIEYDYSHTPVYKHIRQAIQIMNPAIK